MDERQASRGAQRRAPRRGLVASARAGRRSGGGARRAAPRRTLGPARRLLLLGALGLVLGLAGGALAVSLDDGGSSTAARPGGAGSPSPRATADAQTSDGSGSGAADGASGLDPKLRADAGTALALNSQLTLPPAAEAALREGEVDLRVSAVLANLAPQHTVEVARFGPRRGGVLTGVRIASVDGSPADSAAGRDYLRAVRDQIGEFRPNRAVLRGEQIVIVYPAMPTGQG